MSDSKNDKYRILIDKIKSHEPIVNNPEQMTKRIMDSVDRIDRTCKVRSNHFVYIRLALSMVAVLTGVQFLLSIYYDSNIYESKQTSSIYSVKLPDCRCASDMDYMECYRNFVADRIKVRENNINRLSNYLYKKDEL